VETTGKISRLHALNVWGATDTLITHAAAKEAGLVLVQHSVMTVSRLGGECTDTRPVVNSDDRVQTMKAMGVIQIAQVGAVESPVDINERFSLAKCWWTQLARLTGKVDLLIGLDNQGWMPRHVSNSSMEGDNLRLMQFVLRPACMLMGNARRIDPGSSNQGSVEAWSFRAPASWKIPMGDRPQRRGSGACANKRSFWLTVCRGWWP
jgi:hypothetical protein